MLITGHLSEYPMPILLEIFIQRKETGTLEVTCPIASGYFYFSGGELVDATMGKLKGTDAVNFAENLRDAAFKFSPLGPAEYAKAIWSQSFAKTGGSLSEARSSLAVSSSAVLRRVPFYTETTGAFLRAVGKKTAAASLSAFQQLFNNLGSKLMILASQLNRTRVSYRHWVPVTWVLLLAAFVITTLPVYENPYTAPPSTDWGRENSLDQALKNQASLKKMVEPALTSTGAEKKHHAETSRRAGEEKDNRKRKIEPAQKRSPSSFIHVNKTTKSSEKSADGTQAVAVALQIENGRVSKAVVLKHRPGLEAFEASALRIARQRRYDPSTQGNQTIIVRVKSRL